MGIPFADAAGRVVVPVNSNLYIEMCPNLTRLANRTFVGFVSSRTGQKLREVEDNTFTGMDRKRRSSAVGIAIMSKPINELPSFFRGVLQVFTEFLILPAAA